MMFLSDLSNSAPTRIDPFLLQRRSNIPFSFRNIATDFILKISNLSF